ncbi:MULTISPECIES: hypothetical protein [Sphingobacterium]|uniref:hypothetical protein n=1 Tax=Sphingobacterium TaxID=28453 RepID=UPI0013DAC90F|nr:MULTISPECIES: hypothetical protein [unclassified Sphingobacterium]
MKLLKKLILILVGLIALIAISLYLFLKVREQHSKQALVHSESEYVMRVSVDKILSDIARNAIKNPGYYLTKDTTSSTVPDRIKSSDLGLHIPASIYLFTFKDKEGTWYTLLEVDDHQKLQTFLRQRVVGDSIQIEQEGSNWWVSSNDDRMSFYGDSKQVLVALSLEKTGKKQEIMELWNQRIDHMLPISTAEDFNLENSAVDIQWQQRGVSTSGIMSFNQGMIALELSLANSVLRLPSEAQVRALPTSNVLNVYCQADLSPLLMKYKDNLKRYNIPVDTLMRYYGGYLDLQWRSEDVVQMDSVIAYDYDDNFNRIEKKELREESVPNLLFTFKASPHLKSYLPERLFYKFYKTMDGDQIGLSTDAEAKNNYPYHRTNDALHISYQHNDAVQRYLGWVPQLDNIKQILISGRGEGVSSSFAGQVLLKESKIHALYQLLKDK